MVDYREFSRQIKEKYPDYQNVDDLKLANAMIEKYPEYKSQVTFEETPQLEDIQLNDDGSRKQTLQGQVSYDDYVNGNVPADSIVKGRETLPQKLWKGIAKGVSSLGVGLGKNVVNKQIRPLLGKEPLSDEQLDKAYGTLDDKPEGVAENVGSFIGSTAPYMLLPEIGIGQGIGRAALNAGAQGALIGGLESAKNNGLGAQNIQDAGIAAGIGAALPPVIKGVGTGINKAINSDAFKNTVGKGLEVLTSVPKKYIDRALNAELSRNSILKGKFNKDTAYIPVERKLRTALDKLPTKEHTAKIFSDIAKKAKTGIDKKLLEKNVELNNVIRNMPDNAGDISTLRANIDEGLDKFRFGDVNPALEEAGGVINRAKSQLGYKSQDEITEALQNYVNKYKSDIGIGTLDKEGEDIAFNVLAQATGKSKNWLKSQLKAEMPKMSTQKRQEFIQELLENTDDKIENIDPTWVQRFPELEWSNVQETADGGETVARKMFDRIMGKNYRNLLEHPEELMFNEADANYANLLDNLIKTPNAQGYNQALDALDTITRNMDDYAKDLYYERFMKDWDNIENIINPKVQPATLHGVKEMLYDRANFGGDAFGNYGNSGIKSMASDINSYLRQQNPEYARINDELKLLNSVKNDLGGPAGINQNTLSTKLRNIGSEGNTLSNMDERLMNLNYLLDPEYRFFNDARDLAKTQRLQDEMVNLIGANQKLKNPRVLDNITDEGRLNALSQLQRQTGVNFMDELETVRAREALESLFPGQGGGSGSKEGYANLVRSALTGGASVGAALGTGNILPLFGLGLISPKLMAKGTIQNIGRLNNLPQDIPQGLYNLLIQGVGRSAGSEK
jgi:hypothetical protein